MEILVAIVLVGSLIAVYILSYYFNKKTNAPEGTEKRQQEARACSACGSKKRFIVPDEVINTFKEDAYGRNT